MAVLLTLLGVKTGSN